MAKPVPGTNVVRLPTASRREMDQPNNGSDQTPQAPRVGAPILRVLTGGAAKEDNAFNRAYHAAMIARAERELLEARWAADHFLSPIGHYSPLWGQREGAFQAMLEAVVNVALIPAVNKAQIAKKKSVIGKVWLRAEGAMYDQFRERIALDEVHIARRIA